MLSIFFFYSLYLDKTIFHPFLSGRLLNYLVQTKHLETYPKQDVARETFTGATLFIKTSGAPPPTFGALSRRRGKNAR